MRRFTALIFVLSVCSILTNAQITNILGDWATVDDKTGNSYSVVNIYKASNSKYYGKIAKMLIADTEDLVCEACPEPYHNAPLTGLVFIQDMEYKDGCLTGGRLLDPESGKYYYGKISYSPKTGKLELRGSIDKLGWFGRSQFWVRYKKI